MEYKLNSSMIDAIANIYKGDKTCINLNKEVTKELTITSGIKQGCTGSATLFKLITYLIITELEKKGVGFVNQLFKIWILFFADDGLILAHSIEEAKNNIRILVDISKKCGLDINKEKSNIIICNMKEQPDSIEDIKVTDKIKYLGLEIDNKRNYFKSQKENILEKAQRVVIKL